MAGNGPLTTAPCPCCGLPHVCRPVRLWRDEDVRPLYAALGDLIDRRNDYPTSLDPAPAYGRAHADAARLRAAFPAPPEWKDPSDGA